MKLVVVDDYPLEGKTIEFLLKRERPDVTYCGQALSGEAGKELILRLCPDIAIVDVKMPGIDGLALTHELKSLSPRTKVIILSAFGDFSFVQSAIRLGACDYLLKPMCPEELYQAIDRTATRSDSAPPSDEERNTPWGIPQPLANAIKSGLVQESAEAFEHFWTAHVERSDLSIEQARLIGKYFLPKLLMSIKEEDELKNSLLWEEGNYLCSHFTTQVPACPDVKAIRGTLLEYVRSLANIRNYRCHETGEEQIQWAKAVIEQSLGKKITLKMVSEKIFISPFYLSNLFKKRTGANFIDYVIERRIEKAKQLLLTTDDTIELVAAQVGYEESNYFRRLFKKSVGMSPREFRRQGLNRHL